MTGLQIGLYIIGFFAFIYLANSLIDYFLRHSFVGARYRLFVAPGVVIHELSHALAAIFTGQHVQEINVTAPDGGYVVHTSPKEPFSQVVISLAPIFGVTLCFILFTYWLQPGWFNSLDNTNLKTILTTFTDTSFTRWQTWLHIYLTLSLVPALAPSKQDIKVAIPGLIALAVAIFLLLITPLEPYFAKLLGFIITPLLATIIFIVFATLLSLIFYLITALLGETTKMR